MGFQPTTLRDLVGCSDAVSEFMCASHYLAV